MASDNADRNLFPSVLSLQADVLTPAQFVEAPAPSGREAMTRPRPTCWPNAAGCAGRTRHWRPRAENKPMDGC